MLWDARLRRTPRQQKRRALGSLARSPREPPCTPLSRFKDFVGSAPRAPPPRGSPGSRRGHLNAAATAGVPWSPRAAPCLGQRRGPRRIVAAAPQVPPRTASGAGRFADRGRGGPLPPASGGAPLAGHLPYAWRRHRGGGPPPAPPPCHPRPPCVRSVSARYLTRACC